MTDKKREKTDNKQEQKFNERREFLRKSAYAAYATPVIISLLVNKANASESWNPADTGNHWTPPPTPPWINT